MQTDQKALTGYLTMDLKYWRSLLIMTALTLTGSNSVNLEATDENGKPTNHLIPGKLVNLNCTYYYVEPLGVSFINGTGSNIFLWKFLIKTDSEVGAGFEELVKSNKSGDRWVSIAFEVPCCYEDEEIGCMVLDKSAGKCEDVKTFQIGAFSAPSNINGTSCNGTITIQEQKNELPLTCQIFGIQPNAAITWSGGCTEYDSNSTEDEEKCFFNQTSTAMCTAAQSTEMSVTCSAQNSIGKGSCTIMIIKYSHVVELKATDENGKQTDHLLPGKIVNLNCSYKFYPQSMSFYNGSDMTVFGWNFLKGSRKGSPGSGFENLIKSVDNGTRWVSIEFEVPYCYKDDVIMCMVHDKMANKHKGKKSFPIGAIQKPSKINGTNCNEMMTLKGKDKFQLTCQVFGVNPEVNITWSDGCTEDVKETIEDTEKCFFNQASTATCSMFEGTEMSVTCSAENAAGKESCKIMIKEENPLIIILAVAIPLIVVVIAAALVVICVVRRKRAKEKSPSADDIDMNTINNSSDNRSNNGRAPVDNPACDTGPAQLRANSLYERHTDDQRADEGRYEETQSPDGHLYDYARIPHQGQVEEISEYAISPGPQAAMAVQEDVPLAVYACVQKRKPHPCDPSQPKNTKN